MALQKHELFRAQVEHRRRQYYHLHCTATTSRAHDLLIVATPASQLCQRLPRSGTRWSTQDAAETSARPDRARRIATAERADSLSVCLASRLYRQATIVTFFPVP